MQPVQFRPDAPASTVQEANRSHRENFLHRPPPPSVHRVTLEQEQNSRKKFDQGQQL